MPELPDVTVYVEALERRLWSGTAGPRAAERARVERVRIRSPFILRTFDPPIESAEGQAVRAVRRVGKRIAIGLDGELWLVIHLMIAGRLRWVEGNNAKTSPKPSAIEQATIVFDVGTLAITEAGTKKRASMHLVRGDAALAAMDPGGLEIDRASEAEFAARLRSRNHTIKRALTDPRLFAGVGNAYSDEILHAAKLSPLQRTQNLDAQEIATLHATAWAMLAQWTDRLRGEFGLIDAKGHAAVGRFPGAGEITAFRSDFAVHGKFGQACPACGTAVQRIAYAENECNYCPRCQTDGKLLADRSMSRLLKDDWPATIDELESLEAERDRL